MTLVVLIVLITVIAGPFIYDAYGKQIKSVEELPDGTKHWIQNNGAEVWTDKDGKVKAFTANIDRSGI